MAMSALPAAACAAALLFSVTAAAQGSAARLMNELMSGKMPVGGPFTLPDSNGQPRSLSDFRGKLVVLYFGYTSCPDVCPTDLSQIARALRSLGEKAERVQPIFITLDPARDTPALLRDYVAAFDSRFIALRGSEEETRRIATSYKVYYEKVTMRAPGNYLINHATFTFALDTDGRYLAFLPPGTPSDRIATMIRELLAGEYEKPRVVAP